MTYFDIIIVQNMTELGSINVTQSKDFSCLLEHTLPFCEFCVGDNKKSQIYVNCRTASLTKCFIIDYNATQISLGCENNKTRTFNGLNRLFQIIQK